MAKEKACDPTPPVKEIKAGTPIEIQVLSNDPIGPDGTWVEIQADGDMENGINPYRCKLWVWLDGKLTTIPAGVDEDKVIAALNAMKDVIIISNPTGAPEDVKPQYTNRFKNIPDPTP